MIRKSALRSAALAAAALVTAGFASAQFPAVVARAWELSRPAGPDGVWSDSVSGIRQMLDWRRDTGRKPGFLKAYLEFYQRRAYPNDSVDWSAYDRAAQLRDALPVARIRTDTGGQGTLSAAPAWTFVGPKELDVPQPLYFGPGRPVTGRITSIAWHPKDNATVYVATAGGGVWKSTDGGTSWAPKSDSASWDYLQTGAVAVDPRDGNKVYAGLGDQRGFYRNYGRGIMVSPDAGATWARDAATDGSAVSEIAIDPTNSNVLVTTSARTNRNQAAGKVYLKRGNGAFAAIAALPDAVWMGCTIGAKDPADGKRMYYVAGYTLPGDGGRLQIWRGKDGADWTNVTPAAAVRITATNLGSAGVDVSASPGNLQNAYVVSGTDNKVFRTSNGGTTWEDATNNLPKDEVPNDNYNWSQSNYDIHILCSYVPGGNYDVVYCGLITFAATDDRGFTWTDIGKTYQAAARRTTTSIAPPSTRATRTKCSSATTAASTRWCTTPRPRGGATW
jgi:hypothetical protein